MLEIVKEEKKDGKGRMKIGDSDVSRCTGCLSCTKGTRKWTWKKQHWAQNVYVSNEAREWVCAGPWRKKEGFVTRVPVRKKKDGVRALTKRLARSSLEWMDLGVALFG